MRKSLFKKYKTAFSFLVMAGVAFVLYNPESEALNLLKK